MQREEEAFVGGGLGTRCSMAHGFGRVTGRCTAGRYGEISEGIFMRGWANVIASDAWKAVYNEPAFDSRKNRKVLVLLLSLASPAEASFAGSTFTFT